MIKLWDNFVIDADERQYGYDGFKFCPNCGAKMDGDAND